MKALHSCVESSFACQRTFDLHPPSKEEEEEEVEEDDDEKYDESILVLTLRCGLILTVFGQHQNSCSPLHVMTSCGGEPCKGLSNGWENRKWQEDMKPTSGLFLLLFYLSCEHFDALPMPEKCRISLGNTNMRRVFLSHLHSWEQQHPLSLHLQCLKRKW